MDADSGYELLFVSRKTKVESHLKADIATFELYQNGDIVSTIEPRLNHYLATQQTIGTPKTHSGLGEDLYLVLTNLNEDGQGVTIEVHTKPLVWWLWFGGGLMALGCMISVWPTKRKRIDESQVGLTG